MSFDWSALLGQAAGIGGQAIGAIAGVKVPSTRKRRRYKAKRPRYRKGRMTKKEKMKWAVMLAAVSGQQGGGNMLPLLLTMM